jgi:hypothetical protein
MTVINAKGNKIEMTDGKEKETTNQPTVKWILPNQLGLLVSNTLGQKRSQKGPTKTRLNKMLYCNHKTWTFVIVFHPVHLVCLILVI